jgi:hypothetical protein
LSWFCSLIWSCGTSLLFKAIFFFFHFLNLCSDRP